MYMDKFTEVQVHVWHWKFFDVAYDIVTVGLPVICSSTFSLAERDVWLVLLNRKYLKNEEFWVLKNACLSLKRCLFCTAFWGF